MPHRPVMPHEGLLPLVDLFDVRRHGRHGQQLDRTTSTTSSRKRANERKDARSLFFYRCRRRRMSLPRSRSLLRVGVCHSVVHFHDVLGGTRRSTLSAQRYIGCSSGSCQLLSGISISGSLARTLSIMMPSSEKAPRPASIAASNSFLIRSALCCTWGLCIFVCRCEPRIRRRARALAFAVPWRKGRVDERHLSWMDGLLAREAHVGALTRLHSQRVCTARHTLVSARSIANKETSAAYAPVSLKLMCTMSMACRLCAHAYMTRRLRAYSSSRACGVRVMPVSAQ